ncbi:hypothetical protein SARC_03483 [Sphaeroforma arctica JP610]|uniref:Uncharacterized protein n=1 Tax=Sphaeroforma arctica JP610 TaxID=667725 RepID=A0A0L0G5G9_9EUKA|nr:hypothetical protein SARC_03483 [Sphaeroforma arctica JP610]KNC84282.1 hypothetical protein SARC_03483 [Sphaeroforma arctica JP610]|eukprot:XP_014158184.1 hypothetical protein SARC_03483 [Sphaeroforma arctica JP610]
MPTATRAGVYGGEEGDGDTDGASDSPAGGGKPRQWLKPANTREGGIHASSVMRLEIDKSICQGNHVLVSRFVSKLKQTAPVHIPTLHKMRVGIHDQQPERQMSIVDT